MTTPSGPGTANDTTTTLSKGSQDGDTFGESLVQQSSGAFVKQERVVPGDDNGDVIEQFPLRGDIRHALPIQQDPDDRRLQEMTLISAISNSILNFDTRDAFSVGMRDDFRGR
jgi:hypothetical protein